MYNGFWEFNSWRIACISQAPELNSVTFYTRVCVQSFLLRCTQSTMSAWEVWRGQCVLEWSTTLPKTSGKKDEITSARKGDIFFFFFYSWYCFYLWSIKMMVKNQLDKPQHLLFISGWWRWEWSCVRSYLYGFVLLNPQCDKYTLHAQHYWLSKAYICLIQFDYLQYRWHVQIIFCGCYTEFI